MNTAAAVSQPTANTNKEKQTAKEIIAANVQALIEQLEQGHSEALTAYPSKPTGLSWRRSWNGNLKVKTASALPATTVGFCREDRHLKLELGVPGKARSGLPQEI
jgi:hypothetical protein